MYKNVNNPIRRKKFWFLEEERVQQQQQQQQGEEEEEDDDETEEQSLQPTAKIGAKKQRKLEEKQAKKAQREVGGWEYSAHPLFNCRMCSDLLAEKCTIYGRVGFSALFLWCHMLTLKGNEQSVSVELKSFGRLFEVLSISGKEQSLAWVVSESLRHMCIFFLLFYVSFEVIHWQLFSGAEFPIRSALLEHFWLTFRVPLNVFCVVRAKRSFMKHWSIPSQLAHGLATIGNKHKR